MLKIHTALKKCLEPLYGQKTTQLNQLIKENRAITLVIAYCIELNAGKTTSLEDILCQHLKENVGPETTWDVELIQNILKQPIMQPMLDWHQQNLYCRPAPLPEMIGLIDYLLIDPSHTLDGYLTKNIDMHMVPRPHHFQEKFFRRLEFHPLIKIYSLHNASDPGFAEPAYNHIYWVRKFFFRMIFRHNDINRFTRYATYIEILNKKNHSTCVYGSPIEINLDSDAIIHTTKIILSHANSDLSRKYAIDKNILQLVNAKLFHFGFNYLINNDIHNIAKKIKHRPKPISNTTLFTSKESSCTSKTSSPITTSP